MRFFKWLHRKDLELKRDANEAKRLKKEVERATLNGEGEWMLTKKENGKKKTFDCSCTENREAQ